MANLIESRVIIQVTECQWNDRVILIDIVCLRSFQLIPPSPFCFFYIFYTAIVPEYVFFTREAHSLPHVPKFNIKIYVLNFGWIKKKLIWVSNTRIIKNTRFYFILATTTKNRRMPRDLFFAHCLPFSFLTPPASFGNWNFQKIVVLLLLLLFINLSPPSMIFKCQSMRENDRAWRKQGL